MPEMILDPWPNGFGEPKLPTPPLAVLRQYAELLAQKTHNIVLGTVSTKPNGEKFLQNFEVYCPPLGYSYRLFFVEHGIELYPAEIDAHGILPQRVKVTSPEELQQQLAQVLSAPKTLEIIQSLLAQSKS